MDLGEINDLDFREDGDIQKLEAYIDETKTGAQEYFGDLARQWDENIHFFMGHQYIFYDEQSGHWIDQPVSSNEESYLPRPMTNMILPTVQTMTSILTKNKPNADITPNSQDLGDIKAARIAGRVQDAKWEIDEEQQKHLQAAIILMLTGTVIRKDYWDPDKGPDLKDVLNFKKAGDNAVKMISPFEISMDVENKTWFMEEYVKPVYWVKENFDKNEKGYTGKAESVTAETDIGTGISLFTRLQTLSRGGNYNNFFNKDSVVVRELYIKPTKNHPKGLHIVHANGKTLFISESPYFDSRIEESWHPYTFCKWQDPVFRWHGISLVENLVSQQRRLNEIDAHIILNRRTMSNPVWTIPAGSGIPEGYINGRPGLILSYRQMGSNGMKPERIGAPPINPEIFKEREDIIKNIHAIAGDNEVLAGLRPVGVSAAAALGMLLEQTYSKFSTQIQQWERFIERGQTRKMQLIARRYSLPHPQLIARMKMLNKDNTDAEINEFQAGADFRDNINVRIEAGSTLPRSDIMHQERIKEMLQFGMFGPIDPQTNPVGNRELLEKFGMKPLFSDTGHDATKAEYVNEVLHGIDQGQMVPEKYNEIALQPYETNDMNVLAIHLKTLTDEMKKPTFKDGPAFQQRYMEIMQALMNLQQQIAPAPSSQVPLAENPHGTGPAMEQSLVPGGPAGIQ